MTSSPEPQDSRRRLTWDEWIAIVVALLGIGSVFWWALRPRLPGWSSAWMPAQIRSVILPSASPTVTAVPPTPAPTVAAKAPAAGTLSPLTLPPPAPELPTSGAVLPVPTVPAPRATPIAPSSAAPTITQKPPVAATPATPATPTPATPTVESPGQPKNFTDVPVGFWASPYIEELSKRGVITGFTDNTFQPDKPVTRAEFASMIQKAFDQPKVKPTLNFSDIPANYGGAAAIDEAIQTGFMTGYPKGVFKPEQPISRLELLLALATGLKLPLSGADQALANYADANTVPKWATDKIGAAIAADIVVKDNQPNQLKPKQIGTRADAAALIYQALVKEGKVKALPAK
jgi:S-layer homology domain